LGGRRRGEMRLYLVLEWRLLSLVSKCMGTWMKGRFSLEER